MSRRDRFLSFLKILFPCLFVLVLGVLPQSSAVVRALSSAQAAREADMPQQAAEHLSAAVALQPWRSGLWEEIGWLYVEAEAWPRAIEAFQKAQLIDTLTAPAQFRMGEMHIELDEPEAAAAVWQDLVDRQAAWPEVYERLYETFRTMGGFPEALAVLQGWVALEPECPERVYRLGSFLAVTDPEAALNLLETLEADEEWGGKAAALSAALDDALEEAECSYRLVLVGRALGGLGEWDLAAWAFRQAVEASPAYAEAWAFLGEAQQNMGEDGGPALRRAEELAPDSVIVQSLLGVYWRRQGQPEVALVYFHRLAKQEPDQPAWQAEQGRSLAEMGDVIAALPYYQNAAALSLDDPFYWRVLAGFCVENHIEADTVGLAAARKSLALAPDDPLSLDLMGWTLMYLHDFPSAERFLQQAVQVDPLYAAAHLHLGQLYLQLDRPERAKVFLEQAYCLESDTDVGLVAERLLDRYD